MIPYLTSTINQYMPLLLDVNKEYDKLFCLYSLLPDVNIEHDEPFCSHPCELHHISGFMYNWKPLNRHPTCGYTFNGKAFPLSKNY